MSYLDPITYEKMIDAERVEKSALKTATAIGQQEERNKIAKKMLAQNLAIEVICAVTGLNEQEVKALKTGR